MMRQTHPAKWVDTCSGVYCPVLCLARLRGASLGLHLRRTRERLDGPSRLARLSAFREVMYTRMEEISFRSSMTVLAGVVAFAAVVAAVSTLMTVSPGPARHAALGRPPGSAAPSSAHRVWPNGPR